MENTIKNMELTMNHLSNSLKSGDYSASKTLANTYTNLQSGISIARMGRESIIFYSDTFKKQAIETTRLRVYLEKEFEKCMELRKYKDTHTVTYILEQLNSLNAKLVNLSKMKTQEESEAKRIASLPQNRIKEIECVKQVAIFGKNNHSAVVKYGELKKQFSNEITSDSATSSTLVFHTNELRVTAATYSDSFRGLRLDEIYIDKNLSIANLSMIKMMRISENTPIHYF